LVAAQDRHCAAQQQAQSVLSAALPHLLRAPPPPGYLQTAAAPAPRLNHGSAAGDQQGGPGHRPVCGGRAAGLQKLHQAVQVRFACARRFRGRACLQCISALRFRWNQSIQSSRRRRAAGQHAGLIRQRHEGRWRTQETRSRSSPPASPLPPPRGTAPQPQDEVLQQLHLPQRAAKLHGADGRPHRDGARRGLDVGVSFLFAGCIAICRAAAARDGRRATLSFDASSGSCMTG
jgi:hypothetical protein